METVVNLQFLQKYYSDKKVFVTGHTGFKGSWFIALLHVFGARIKGYALEPEYKQCLFNFLKPVDIGESIIADIRDKKKLSEQILSFQPDYIFHLAAQPLVRRSYVIPSETFEINVIGTANILETLRELSNNCTAVIVTTDKVYENKEQDVLYKENDVLGGYDPYSASKACAEIVVNSFRNSFFKVQQYAVHQKAIASARAGNVIGGGDWNTDRIIPDIVRALQQKEVIKVRNPYAIRPWQHVLEPLVGYLQLGRLLNIQPGEYSKPFNFGPYPEDHLTVNKLVELAIARWGSGEWQDVSDPELPHEAGLLKLDINQALSQLQWKPKLNATKAIEWTIDWYKQPSHKQMEFTFGQIENYLTL
jgi:CDP-glucose 4,6-dehydratase